MQTWRDGSRSSWASFSDVWNEACALAPLSLRLRLTLEVLQRNRHRPVTPTHPIHRLPGLVAEVKAMQAPAPSRAPETYGEALRGLVNKPWLATVRFKEQGLVARREGAHAAILEFEAAFCRRFRKLGVPVYAAAMVVSQAEQARLYVQGLSPSKPGRSPHNWGCAVDLRHALPGLVLTRHQWSIFGHVGHELARARGLELVWGGSWSSYEPEHWELKDWKSRRGQS